MKPTHKLIHGDCLEELPNLPDNYFDSIVTDPPYGISFMGKAWDHGVPSVAIWRECYRVLKPGGYLLSFAGTRTQHRMATNIEDAGFEIRDMIGWMYGSGFPKSHNISKAIDKMAIVDCPVCDGAKYTAPYESVDEWYAMRDDWKPDGTSGLVLCQHCGGSGKVKGAEREVVGQKRAGIGRNGRTDEDVFGSTCDEKLKAVDITTPATPAAIEWDGWGTALKPAFEPITVARKPLSESTVAANVLKWGTGGINIDGCRVGHNEPIKTMKAQTGGNKVYAQAGRKEETTELKESGRFPANICHDGSDEVLALFPETKSGSGNKNTKNRNGIYGMLGAGNGDGIGGDSGSAARFFYCAKASKQDRDAGLGGFEKVAAGALNMRTDAHSIKNNMDTNPRANNHPTVKPTDLMRYLCRLVTPPNGHTLDPFCGSGSTGRGAMLEGFDFTGIDLDAHNIAISEARINEALTTARNKAGEFTPTAKEKQSGQLNIFEMMPAQIKLRGLTADEYDETFGGDAMKR